MYMVLSINMWEKSKLNEERERKGKIEWEGSEKPIVFFFFLTTKGILGNFEN